MQAHGPAGVERRPLLADGLDREARRLQALERALERVGGRVGVGHHQLQARAAGERLADPQPRPDALRLGRRRAQPHHLGGARRGAERHRRVGRRARLEERHQERRGGGGGRPRSSNTCSPIARTASSRAGPSGATAPCRALRDAAPRRSTRRRARRMSLVMADLGDHADDARPRALLLDGDRASRARLRALLEGAGWRPDPTAGDADAVRRRGIRPGPGGLRRLAAPGAPVARPARRPRGGGGRALPRRPHRAGRRGRRGRGPRGRRRRLPAAPRPPRRPDRPAGRRPARGPRRAAACAAPSPPPPASGSGPPRCCRPCRTAW